MFSILHGMDAAVLLFIQNTLRNPVFTAFFKFITGLGDHGMIWILITLILLCFGKTRKIGLICAAALLTEYVLGDLLIKRMVARTRPYEVVEGLTRLIKAQRDYSFPSGHTGSSFACACILYRMTPRKYGIAALVLAALIGFSRLYLGVHYPSDVIAGMLFGTGVSAAVYYAMRQKWSRR